MPRQAICRSTKPFPESFADHDAPLINYYWLAQLGAYFVFRAGQWLALPDFDHQLGGGALFLGTAHALIVTLRMFVLLLAFARLTSERMGTNISWKGGRSEQGGKTDSDSSFILHPSSFLSPVAILGVVAVTLMALPVHLVIIRPQILGELFFAVVLLALSRPVLSRRALLYVPLCFLLWANCHGSFPAGFILLGTAVLGHALTVVRKKWGVGSGEWGVGKKVLRAIQRTAAALAGDVQMRRLAAVFVLSLAAAMVNPYGPMLFWHVWQLSGNGNISSMSEWQPLFVKGLAGYVFLGSVLFLIPLFRKSPARFTATQIVLLVVFGWQTLCHARMLLWWIMIVTWVAVPHVHALCKRYLYRPGADSRQPNLVNTILAVLVTVVIFLWSAPTQWLIFRNLPEGTKRVYFKTPVAVAQELERVYARDSALPRCIFTSETQGDYLLWHLRHLPVPVRIFCYSHAHLFSPEHWQECQEVKSGSYKWQTILDRYGVEYIVVDPDKDWQLVDAVKVVPDRWQVIHSAPIFVAKRK